MKRSLILLPVAILAFTLLWSMRERDEWIPMLDKGLTQWQTYLSYQHKNGYNGKIPKDSLGNPVAPIGYNKDKTKVFSILEEPGGPVLRVSGEFYGCLFTEDTYENFHLKLQVKWGSQKFEPRINKLRDSGILYHSNGEAGAEYWRSWMLSQEFQVMEGHMGDFWCQANGAIDIRSFQSEGVMPCVADDKQSFRSFKPGSDGFCLRSQNFESAPGEWTTLELICFEGKSLHIVNGHVVMVLKNSRYIDAQGQDVPMTSGRIQLQSEAAEVFYRDIKIRKLKSMPDAYKGLF
jgi:hypothetical protein